MKLGVERFDQLCGLKVIEDKYLAEVTEPRQIRFPKRTNKRERARWRRNRKNWDKGGEPVVMRMGNMLMMHPNTLTKLRHLFGAKEAT